MNDERYLGDPEINRLLDQVEENAGHVREYRQQGNYSGVSFYLGALAGIAGLIRQRNTEIEILSRRKAQSS